MQLAYTSVLLHYFLIITTIPLSLIHEPNELTLPITKTLLPQYRKYHVPLKFL